MTLNAQEVLEIVKALQESQCEELHLKLGDDSLTLRRTVTRKSTSAAAKPAPAPQPASPKTPASSAPAASSQHASPPASADPEPVTGGEQVLSPMSGCFYRSSAPDEPPFVEVGSVVRKGDPICVIEVMKLFSTVYAECDGQVTGIYVQDSETVEKNQLLFVMEPVGV